MMGLLVDAQAWSWATATDADWEEKRDQAAIDLRRAQRNYGMVMAAAAIRELRVLFPTGAEALFEPAGEPSSTATIEVVIHDSGRQEGVQDIDDLQPAQDCLTAAMENGIRFRERDGFHVLPLCSAAAQA